MKLSLLQENLNKAVSAAARGVSSKPQLPILSNVLLKAEKGKLMVIGTDMSLSIGISIGGKVEKEGGITVPARDFLSLVSSLSTDRIELSEEKGVLLLRSGAVKAKLVGISASEFPNIESQGKRQMTIPLAEFAAAARQVLFATGQDDSRPILTGVKMEVIEKHLTMTATDGYRLSRVDLSEGEQQLDHSVVIPSRVLSEVIRLAAGESVVLEFTDDGGITFSFEGGWISGKLLAGEFPPAERIIPKKLDVEISFEKREFEQAIRIAAVFARQSANIVRFKINKRKMVISANSPQVGENETELEIDNLSGGEEERVIAFNSRYLLDWIGSVDPERLEFGMVDSLKPGVFRPASPGQGGPTGDKNYLHVIMPVRVQKNE